MAETKREVTVEEVLAAAKEGTDSAAWASLASGNIIMAAGAKALKKAIESGEQVLEYKKPQPDTYDTNINTIKDKANYIPRGEHQAWFNKNGSVALKEDGTVSMASSTVNHLELTPGGGTYITNVETEIKTNSFSLQSEDVIVNNHKLNNKLYELADFKRVLNTYDGTPCIAGGLTMLGTVLVKAWEPNLQRYVLVRRQINLPVFSPEIGGVDVHPGLNITPDTEFILNFRKMLNKTGISSYEDLLSTMEMNRAAAVATQEQATAAKNEEIKATADAVPVVSMTTMTGQDPVTFGASSIVASAMSSTAHGGGGGSFSNVVEADGYQWMDPTGTNKDARNQCASFASQMMKSAGVPIDIVVNGDVLAGQFKAVGAYHSPGDGYRPQPGDLIDWAHHVGIYAGNGQYIARNSSGGVKRGSMAGMEQYFGTLWGYGSIAQLKAAKGISAT